MKYVLLKVEDVPPSVEKELWEIEGVRYVNADRKYIGFEFDMQTNLVPHQKVCGLLLRSGISILEKDTLPTLAELIKGAEKIDVPPRPLKSYSREELRDEFMKLREFLNGNIEVAK